MENYNRNCRFWLWAVKLSFVIMTVDNRIKNPVVFINFEDFLFCCPQCRSIYGTNSRYFRHPSYPAVDNISKFCFKDRYHIFKFQLFAQCYITLGGFLSSTMGRFARTSNPCMSKAYCSFVIKTASFAERGHLKVPILILL